MKVLQAEIQRIYDVNVCTDTSSTSVNVEQLRLINEQQALIHKLQQALHWNTKSKKKSTKKKSTKKNKKKKSTKKSKRK